MLNQDTPFSHLDFLNEEPPPIHSVLEITTIRGEEFIFDGTPEQFGWSDSAWTQDKKDIEMYYVEGQTGMWESNDDDKRQLRRLVLETDPRPWSILFAQMEELLAQLDWDMFKGFDDGELWRRITDQARRKFVTREP